MILFLNPYFSKKPWAGNELQKIYNCDAGTGEAWLISGFKDKSSVIANGQYKGKTLRWLWTNKPELFGNMIDKEFPLLIKLISAGEKLSVQVHPNDDYAIKKHNQLGKSECWYILPGNTAKTAAVGVNVKNKIELREVVEKNILENFLIQQPIKDNNLVVVDPGTVHAMNEGALVLEIQESSDVTYRLYDYNREPKRELHLDDACAVVDYNNDKKRIIDFDKQKSFANNFFKINRYKIKNAKKFDINGFSIFYVLDGTGMYNKYYFKKGDVFVATADTKSLNITGNVDLLEIVPVPNTRDRFAKKTPVALITGALNQDGYYLTKLLLEKGYAVCAQYFEQAKYDNCILKEFESNPNFHPILFDLASNGNITDAMAKIKPDEIYHFAGEMQVGKSFDKPELAVTINAVSTVRLLEAIKNGEIRTKLFNLETPYLFKGDIYPQNEQTPIYPGSPYAIAKHFGLELAKSYRDNFGMYVVNGICYNHESAVKNDFFVAKKICAAANRIAAGSDEILELGNLNAVREFGHAEDYAKAMWLTMQQDMGDDYVIATGEAYTIRELTSRAFAKKGITIEWYGEDLQEIGIDTKTKKVIVSVNPQLIRPNDAEVLVGDASYFKSKIDFDFKHNIDDLIDELLEATK